MHGWRASSLVARLRLQSVQWEKGEARQKKEGQGAERRGERHGSRVAACTHLVVPFGPVVSLGHDEHDEPRSRAKRMLDKLDRLLVLVAKRWVEADDEVVLRQVLRHLQRRTDEPESTTRPASVGTTHTRCERETASSRATLIATAGITATSTTVTSITASSTTVTNLISAHPQQRPSSSLPPHQHCVPRHPHLDSEPRLADKIVRALARREHIKRDGLERLLGRRVQK